MTKLFWKVLKLSPTILSAALLLANRIQAAETSVAELTTNKAAVTSQTAASVVAQKLDSSTTSQPRHNTLAPEALAQVTSVSQLSNQAPEALAQVTSVSQLSDVQPTDWAFQALQSLVERYGCIAGYPDGTYRGNRALTRYEFAAGLNACLDRVNELIATATANLVSKEDLATLQRLQEEFAAELATLRGRVDALEAQTAELEANQFSTTTKLNGEAIAVVADVFGDNQAVDSGEDETAAEDLDVNTILADRVRLNFDTSFTGEDQLRIRLQARNITEFDNELTGTSMTRLAFDGDEGNDVQIDDFYYRFPISKIAEVQVAFAETEFYDSLETFNPALESSGRGALSRFGRFNPIYRQGSDGAGVTVKINPEGVLGVSLGYLAPDASDPSEGASLFNGPFAALGQVSFRPSERFSLGLTYVHSYNTELGDDTGSTFANDPFDGATTSSNQYGVEVAWQIVPKITFSAWGGLTYATVEDGDGGDSPDEVTTGDEATSYNWAATLAIQDLLKEGSVLGIIFGQPPKLTANQFGASNTRIDDDNAYHLEGLFRFSLTDNIEITPGVLVIFNPEHNSDNDNIYVGTIRTTFSF